MAVLRGVQYEASFWLLDSDGNPVTGQASNLTAYVRQYGSNAYSTGAGTITEITLGGNGTGEYRYVPTASEMNTRVLTVRLVHNIHKVYPFCAQIWTEDSYISNIKAKTDNITFDAANNVLANTVAMDSNAVAPIWSYSTRTLTGNVTVGGYASGQNPANYVLVTPANKLATDASGRVTVGSNADKSNYQVGSYATGQSPAEQVLATPANKLATDASGRVTVGTNADKSGYALSSGEHSNIASAVWSAASRTLTSVGTLVSDVASAVWGYATRTLTGNVTVGGYASGQNPAEYVLATPANKLATDASGRVTVGSNADKSNYQVGSYATGQSPAEQVLATPANKLATDASGRVTVGSNADKTGYSLTTGEHTQIQSDVQSGLTAQGYTTARAPRLDNLDATVSSRAAPGAAMTLTSGERSNIATAVWSAASRTLTSFGTLVSDIWSHSSRTLTSFGTLVADIWDHSTRTLTSLGTLANDTAAAVWGYSTRTLTSFGTLVSDVAAAVWSYVIEGGQSALAWMRLMGAALFGKLTRSGNSYAFRDWNDTKNRIAGSVDNDGNRTISTRDGS